MFHLIFSLIYFVIYLILILLGPVLELIVFAGFLFVAGWAAWAYLHDPSRHPGRKAKE